MSDDPDYLFALKLQQELDAENEEPHVSVQKEQRNCEFQKCKLLTGCERITERSRQGLSIGSNAAK